MPYLTRILRTSSQSTAFGRRSLHTGVAIAGAMEMASTAANAWGTYGNANGPARDGLAQVQQVCETVVRLRPGEVHFDACVSSLAGSLRDMKPEHGAMPAIEVAETPESYAGTSFTAVRHREEQACARVGFNPAFGAFSSCVADLQASLQWYDTPNN